MSMTFIWAMGENRVIGRNNALPWRLPRDMAFFKEQTIGKKVLMGRKTWESFGGKPLPGRTNIILTRDPDYSAPGAQIIHTIDEALKLGVEEELMVIGGSEIYRTLLPHADRLLVTEIEESFEGDTFFPEINEAEWKCVQEVQGIRDEKNPYNYRFCTYVRV
ncbi:dihydrofolate reductase [Paenibacillus sp. HJL G12]|uniref:Dihydrofolate reductase n=1 Tax=Paenibacillus dendrobii TaxID=2691084 RepID=A0A7X3IEB1_9BACL|nr:dihydrofolate reductase [Paenibacillus dendrobii]MWV42295.1 dihydrofolate reductase [Paenibacillus dendrobii]